MNQPDELDGPDEPGVRAELSLEPRQDSKGAGQHQVKKGSIRLSRDVVLRAALELVDADGLEALSMRKLGNKLGKDPMALYRYAANRDALLDGMTELLLDQWIVPRTGDLPSWQEQLRHAAHDFRALVLQHPHVVPLLVTRPLSTPMGLRPLGALRPLEQILAVLSGAGFAPADALHAYRAYYGFLIGHILNELEEFVVNPDEDELGLKLGLHRLPKKDFPHLRQLAPMLLGYDGEAELDQGITILLQGLQAQLNPSPE
ncbi:AcrR family transcriptional regulator [Arthrobacter sp. PL16]|uniref:TetR/AcrR family transcriptional regulator C-terminal domain-containing protein n=1 Tax=Arthrobacter sp. PL16 TaxID=3071720 RepID=UPI002DFA83DD|nr:AcrR family transcriptional regulator [Arthrobacter sp. PL16]